MDNQTLEFVMIFIQNCKFCNEKITKYSKSGLCKACCKKGKKYTEYSNSLKGNRNPSPKKGTKLPKSTIKKMCAAKSGIKHPMYGKRPSKETIERIRVSHMGKKHSKETIRKLRLLKIDEISKNKFNGHQVIPGWNPIACQKIDEYGKLNGYKFQHAMNGGEFYIENLGYWVDGYDKERNTVIEYYEKKHDIKIQKDLERETEICNHLGCDFIILWEN